MDVVSYLELRSNGPAGPGQRDSIPTVEISRMSSLADPERPSFSEPRDAAASLFAHLARTLSEREPALNPQWQALYSVAAGIRHDQQPKLPPVSAEAEDMDSTQLDLLVHTAISRERLHERLGASIAAHQINQAMQTMDNTALLHAMKTNLRSQAPKSNIAGVAEAWNSPEGKQYRTDLAKLAAAAKSDAKVKNVDIQNENEDRSPDEMMPLVDPEETVKKWLRSMNVARTNPLLRRTDKFMTAMETEEEARVMRAFIDVALKAYDTKTLPTAAQLGADIEKIRADFATPEYQFMAAGNNAAPNGGLSKPVTLAVVTRPAITDRSVDYRNGGQIEDRGANQEDVLAKLSMSDRPMIGIEGQRYYDNLACIKQAISNARTQNAGKGIFISHAPEGSALRKTIEKAAEELGMPVVSAPLKMEKSSMRIDTNKTLEHFDGRYAAPMLHQNQTTVTCNLPVNFNGQEKQAPITSSSVRSFYKGSLIFVDAKGKDESALAQASLTHAALTPNRVIGFGIDRNDQTFSRLLARRQLSGLEQATVFDRYGKVVSPAMIAAKIQTDGQTPRQQRAGQALNRVEALETKTAFGQLLLTETVGADKAKILLSEFNTIGDVLRAGSEVKNAPRDAEAIAASHHVSMNGIKAAAAFDTARQDVDRFAHITDNLKVIAEINKTESTTILANPADKIVDRHGHLVGFSALRDGKTGELLVNGPSIAIVGSANPISTANAENIDKIIAEVVKKYGRDTDGVANVRLVTTMTEGTGAAVMEAGLRHKVPVEAISNLDIRGIKNSPEAIALFTHADRLDEAGLGGMWSLHKYQNGASQPAPASALRAAIEAADATIVTQAKGRDIETLTIAGAGQTKPVFVMAPADPIPSAYAGNNILTSKDRTIATLIDIDGQSKFNVLENTVYHPLKTEGRSYVQASVSTKAGAMPIEKMSDLENVFEAASGKLDATMARARPMRELPQHVVETIPMRWDVIQSIDLDRYGDRNDRKYRQSLDLTPQEMKFAESARMQFVEEHSVLTPGVRTKLSEQMTERQSRRRSAEAGM